VHRFFAKRIVRIVPPYYAALAVLLVGALGLNAAHIPLPGGMPNFPFTGWDVLKKALFLDWHTNFLNAWCGTLAVERRWYRLCPLALALWIGAPRALRALAAASSIAYGFTRMQAPDVGVLLPFLLGIVAADFHARGRRLERGFWLLIPTCIIIGVFVEPLVWMPSPYGVENATFVQTNPAWQIAMFALLFFPAAASAQFVTKHTGCGEEEIAANPNRPTIANPADITQYGVLEVEYGWDRTRVDPASTQSDLAGLVKFGLLCDVEIRWNTTTVLWQRDANGRQTGAGDNWLGPQYRFYKQTAHVPSLAVSYQAKIPSASLDQGLGSGRVDHAFTFLASKDIGGFNFDYNFSAFRVRPQSGGAFDHNYQMNLTLARTLTHGFGFTGEFYGDTELNPTQPSFVSTLWAVTYGPSKRLVFDTGVETGLSRFAPEYHVFAGFTYSIANLYRR